MAVLVLRFCARAFSSCGKRGPLFMAVRGPLTIAASLVAEHRLQTRRLSSCGSRAQLLCGTWDPPRRGLEPVSAALAGRFSTTAPPGKPHPWLFSLMISSSAFSLSVFLDPLLFGCWTSRPSCLYFLSLFLLFLIFFVFLLYNLEEFLNLVFQLFCWVSSSLFHIFNGWELCCYSSLFFIIAFFGFLKGLCISYKRLFQDILPFCGCYFEWNIFSTIF